MKPNIIIVLADGLRPKDLSLYGYDIETDKNIKKIAFESIVFKKNFSASTASDPSLTSIFSGQLPITHGFIHQHPFAKNEEINKLRKNKFWLSLYLKNIGYSTISVTPLHLWFKKGFDSYKEEKYEKGGNFLNIPFIKRILLALPGCIYKFGKRLVKIRASPSFISAEEIIDSTILKIKEDKKKPFFLFMHLVDTHYPYASAKNSFHGGEISINKILENIRYPKQKEYIKKRFFDTKTKYFEEIERKRDDSIKFVDKQIGKLYSFLRENKLWNNTIFIFLSDHGDNFGEHNVYFCRGGLYDSSVHVPLIMHLPKTSPKIIDELTQSIDIFPTILEFLEQKKLKMDGKSMIPLIKHGEKIRNYVILNDGFCEKRNAVRTKNRKIIISDGSKCNLCGAKHGIEKEEYNLENDPEEINNIYSKKSILERFI